MMGENKKSKWERKVVGKSARKNRRKWKKCAKTGARNRCQKKWSFLYAGQARVIFCLKILVFFFPTISFILFYLLFFFLLFSQLYAGRMQPMLLAKIIVNRDRNRFLIGHLFIILRNDTHSDDNCLRENQIFLIAGQINDQIAIVKVSNFWCGSFGWEFVTESNFYHEEDVAIINLIIDAPKCIISRKISKSTFLYSKFPNSFWMLHLLDALILLQIFLILLERW